MLANNQYPVAKREALTGEVHYRRVECGVPDGHAGRRSEDPAHVLVRPVPHFYPEWEAGRDVMQVRVDELAQEFIDPKVRV